MLCVTLGKLMLCVSFVPEAFSHTITVQDADIDELLHASNVAVVRWVQDVAYAHSKHVGYGFEEYRRLGGVFVVRRTHVEYLRPALRGDVLRLRTWLSGWMAAKYERETEIVRLGDGVMLATASVTWGFVDAASGRPRRVPDDVRIAFGLPPVKADHSTTHT